MLSLTLTLLVALVGCGSRTAPPPEPGSSQGVPPDLRGSTVMLLPIQQVMGVPGNPDAELLFGLRSRATDVTWVPPEDLDRALARSPSLDARTRGLAVGQFLSAEVLRVGDPLFGELYRLSALVDAQAAVLPIRAELVQNPDEQHPRVRLTVTLIDTRSGRVAWFAVLEGEPHPTDDPRLLASAVDEVSRTLLWYVGDEDSS
ncbi:MAG: hypothetical protein U5R14_12990 [Gemmatimonadota bacterium]|nr:hypothetical protein [Gemmatimonadota bacterium]